MNNEEYNIRPHAYGDSRAREMQEGALPRPEEQSELWSRSGVVVLRRKKSLSSNDFVIEEDNGAEVGAIVETDKKSPRLFRAFRTFDIGGPRIGLQAKIALKRANPLVGRKLYTVVRPDGSPLAELRLTNGFFRKINVIPASGKPMELRQRGVHRMEVVSLQSQAKIADVDFRLRRGVRYTLKFSPGMSSEWQTLVMSAVLAMDLVRRMRTTFLPGALRG